jgi:hypothetical protein
MHYNSMTNSNEQMYITALKFAVIFSKALNCYMFPNLLFHRKGVRVLLYIRIT